MHAENYELLNAPRTKRAMVYGKMYVDFNAMLRGPVEELVMGEHEHIGEDQCDLCPERLSLDGERPFGDMVTLSISTTQLR